MLFKNVANHLKKEMNDLREEEFHEYSSDLPNFMINMIFNLIGCLALADTESSDSDKS